MQDMAEQLIVHQKVKIQHKSQEKYFENKGIYEVKDQTVKELSGYYLGWYANGFPLVVLVEQVNLIPL